MKERVYIGLGSNLGDASANVLKAIDLIQEELGDAIAISSLYESEPWGFESENNFINAVIAIKTDVAPEKLLEAMLNIERKLGRKPKEGKGYASRLIDLDLLDYKRYKINKNYLVLPHPFLHKRAFVLVPLKEIAPNWSHPISGKSVTELIEELGDTEKIKKMN